MLINYVGLDSAIVDYVCEIEGSLKIGKCIPGTLIPVVEESRMTSPIAALSSPGTSRPNLRRSCGRKATREN
jgi:hypothetical protein